LLGWTHGRKAAPREGECTLRENSAHRIAWALAQGTNRLLVAFLKATKSEASNKDIEGFVAAVVEERARMPKEFADS
jgi:hypothetical protein